MKSWAGHIVLGVIGMKCSSVSFQIKRMIFIKVDLVKS